MEEQNQMRREECASCGAEMREGSAFGMLGIGFYLCEDCARRAREALLRARGHRECDRNAEPQAEEDKALPPEEDGVKEWEMRCRRDHRRHKVTRRWLDEVSQWLCPKCYHSLTAEERARYDSNGRIPPLIRIARDPIAEKPTEKPIETPREALEPKPMTAPRESTEAPRVALKAVLGAAVEESVAELREESMGKAEEPPMATPIPRYVSNDPKEICELTDKGNVRFGCIGCGETVVTNGRAFAEHPYFCSRCRGCISEVQKEQMQRSFWNQHAEAVEAREQMRTKMRTRFNIKEGIRSGSNMFSPEEQSELPKEGKAPIKNPPVRLPYVGTEMYQRIIREEYDRKAEVYKERAQYERDTKTQRGERERTRAEEVNSKKATKNAPKGVADIATVMDRWSTSTIMRSTEKELRVALKRGRISETRYRMEMKRRANPGFFASVGV